MAKPTTPIWTPGAIGTEGCRGYWPLHEGSGTTVSDISPGGNHGSFVGAPTWSTGPYGPQLSGFGLSDLVNLPPPATHPMNGPYPAWMASLAASPSTAQGWVLSLIDDSNDSHWAIRYNGSASSRSAAQAGQLGLFVYRAGWRSAVASPADLNDGQMHVAMGIAYSPTDRRLYWDGVEVGTSTAEATGFGVPHTFLLGSRTAAFAGAIAAVAWGQGAAPDPAALAADWLSGTFAAARGGAAPEIILPGPLILDSPLPPGELVFSW